MNPKREDEAYALFESALKQPREKRLEFIAAGCAGDEEMHRDVLMLLSSHESAGSFMEKPIGDAALVEARTDPDKEFDSSMTGRTLGQYMVGVKLGQGGMGRVYKATDTRLKRTVAIKVLPPHFADDPEMKQRFAREAQTIAGLNHPHICTLHDIGRYENIDFLVMEYLDGETLADVVKRGPIPAEKALKLALQIAFAIEAAHEKGVVHRDLKPANIKVSTEGKVKVLDFGLAKALQTDNQDTAATTAATAKGIILGTAAYMSPEQARGMSVDTRTDIWAFGCVLYEMLTGRRAFGGAMASDILASVLARDVDFTQLENRLNPRIQETLQHCLEKDPNQRWRSMGDLRFELERILANGVFAPATTATRAPKGKLRLVLSWIAAAVLGGAAAAWIVKTALPSEPRPLGRFEYELPAEQTLRFVNGTTMALSPDGRHFVYNTLNGLFLRSMDSLTARLIPGTEPALFNPFLSPDGEWAAYLNREGLWKISIAGGTPLPIASFTGFNGGASWGADGSILFAQPEGILRFSSGGGRPELVIKTNAGEHADCPSMLPDGKTILYTLTRALGPTRWDQAEIVAQSMNSAPKVLFRGGSDARYVPTGHIVYAVADSLYAVPFDVAALAVHGNAVSIVSGVQRAGDQAEDTGCANFGFSNRGDLVYLSSRTVSSADQSFLAIVNRDGKVQRLDVPPGNYRNPRASSDGHSIAVETIAKNGQSTISVYDLTLKTPLRPLTQVGSNTHPIWTRDGKSVAYGSDRESAYGIFLQSADGKGLPRRLTTAEKGIRHFPESWSPGDRVLAFDAIGANQGSDQGLWTLAMDSKDAKPELYYDAPKVIESGASFSSDGKWIAYFTNDGENGQFGIYVRPYPRTPVVKYPISKDGGAWPVWIGNEMFFRQNIGNGEPPKIRVATVTTNPVPSPTSEKAFPIQGFVPVIYNREYDIMPDGRFLIVLSPAPAASAQRPRIHIVLNWFEELKSRVPIR